tara:strand:+ start:1355 stop:1612 length:258 start_codon:yes stop_codon:yes gene_type:complete
MEGKKAKPVFTIPTARRDRSRDLLIRGVEKSEALRSISHVSFLFLFILERTEARRFSRVKNQRVPTLNYKNLKTLFSKQKIKANK